MSGKSFSCWSISVALLAEGVDRNKSADYIPQKEWKSPSSRRAWIEIPTRKWKLDMNFVALLAEGVDRNHVPSFARLIMVGRPPRGGRG